MTHNEFPRFPNRVPSPESDTRWSRPVHLVREASRVVRDEGLLFLARKVERVCRVGVRRLASRHHRPNLRRWAELRGLFSGERAFLIGNGPSLNRTPLHLLESENTLCFNRFNMMFERLSWRPTMYMNVDPLVASDMAEEIAEIIPQVRFTFLPDFHYDDGRYYRGEIKGADDAYWLYHAPGGFRTDLPNYWAGGTVAFAGLQVLAYMGFNPIYLVGVDMSYRIHTTALADGRGGIVSTKDDDPNHFDPRYFGKGRNYHQPDAKVLASIDAAFARARRFADRNGLRIVNAGVGGELEHFPRKELREVLAIPATEEHARVDRAVRAASGGAGLGDVLAKARTLHSANSWDPGERYIQADEDTGYSVIKTALLTHVPVGPFESRYLFVRR